MGQLARKRSSNPQGANKYIPGSQIAVYTEVGLSACVFDPELCQLSDTGGLTSRSGVITSLSTLRVIPLLTPLLHTGPSLIHQTFITECLGKGADGLGVGYELYDLTGLRLFRDIYIYINIYIYI